MRAHLTFFGHCVLLLAIATAGACGHAERRSAWPSFRGPDASGVADGQNPPIEWDVRSGENVLWQTPIPGLGHSSPIVWGDLVFLTTAISEDPDSIFRPGFSEQKDMRTDRSPHRWRVYAIDRQSGDVAWMREPFSGRPVTQRHAQNSYATATPATDGEHLIVLLATGVLYCYSFDGKLLWEIDLGPLDVGASYDEEYDWAAGSSPIIWEDLVIVQADQQHGSRPGAPSVTSFRRCRRRRFIAVRIGTRWSLTGRNRCVATTRARAKNSGGCRAIPQTDPRSAATPGRGRPSRRR